MRKYNLFVSVITVISLFLFTGCNNSNLSDAGKEDKEPVGDIMSMSYHNTEIPIYDMTSQEIGSITCFNYSLLIDNYILYSKLPKNNVYEITEMEYHLYDIDTKEDYPLSTISGWYYEATYEAVNIDNHLYISVSTGEYASRENSKQTIYDIDLTEHRMSPILEVESGIPYNSYTIVGALLTKSKAIYVRLLFYKIEICAESSEARPKSAIQVRNRSIFDRSDLVICCVQHKSGGAYAAIRYAEKQGKKIVNLADEN